MTLVVEKVLKNYIRNKNYHYVLYKKISPKTDDIKNCRQYGVMNCKHF